MDFTNIILVIAVLMLSFSNGANDNFKGVASLWGSKSTSFKQALSWATLTTMSGSITAYFFAERLLKNFSGKGLVPDTVLGTDMFMVYVALSAAITIFLATRFGFPISTTHALVGALTGVGFGASPVGVNLSKLTSSFFLPLLFSPAISIALAMLFYPIALRALSLIRKKDCLCIDTPIAIRKYETNMGVLLTNEIINPIHIDKFEKCDVENLGVFGQLKTGTLLHQLHFLSSGLVSFARGLNDTPKIAAILLLNKLIPSSLSLMMVAIVIAIGGILYSRRVAQTMSNEITTMTAEEGLFSNLITSLVVVGASLSGNPVSTTHVSCGALFGVGAKSDNANWRSIYKIIASWITTLPVAFGIAQILWLLGKGV